MQEHEWEPAPGLPGELPEDEKVLWRGAPRWQSLAVHAFHVRKFAVYFALLVAWGVAERVAAGTDALAVLRATVGPLVLAGGALGLLVLLAWGAARASVYTVTSRRVVIRHGIALPVAINVPFAAVEGADLKRHGDRTGDLSVQLVRGQRAGYLVNWPHVRPWRFARPEPALRSVADAEQVGAILADALAAYHGLSARGVAPAAAVGAPPAGARPATA